MSKIVCTICARGGSKGVPLKNIKMIGGKPLIAHSIEQAKASGIFDAIAVSSDSQQILDVAKSYDADFTIKRPDELASDSAGKLPAIIHAFQTVEALAGKQFDIVVDLDCTSPLRSVDDIKKCVELLTAGDFANVVTAMPSRRSPYFNMLEKTSDGKVRLSKTLDTPVLRRQDAPEVFDMNASIYVWTRQSLLSADKVIGPRCGLYVMPEERSWDIDSEFDFKLVELLFRQRNEQ